MLHIAVHCQLLTSSRTFVFTKPAHFHVDPLAHRYRQVYGFQFLTSQDFNVHLRTNKAHFNQPAPMLDAAHGGVYPIYASPPGDAHTSYALLPGDRGGLLGPPTELWESHRGWFWPQADNRSQEYGQLCWSNRSLQEFLASSVKGFLRAQPAATLISVSQNDNSNLCETPEEQAVVTAEGGAAMGPMLRAINFIADSIKDEFPGVAVCTLAYGGTFTINRHIACACNGGT